MSRIRSYVAAGGAFAVAVALSQVRYGEDQSFPATFGEVTAEEHGHEKGLDAVTDFFEGRRVAGMLLWLSYTLGMIFLIKGVRAGGLTDPSS